MRAFEKHFAEKYNGKNKIYDLLDEIEIEDVTGKLKLFVTSETIIDIPNHMRVTQTDLPSGVVV